MKPDEMDGVLAATLEDNRLSRGEKHAIRELLGDADIPPRDHPFFRSRAFALAADKMPDEASRQVLGWLEGVVKAIAARDSEGQNSGSSTQSEVHFSPGHSPLRAITRQLEAAKKSVDICVFTITDNRLTTAIEAAHRRGVPVRVISDDDKAHDRGSDIRRLAESGVDVRVDRTEHHMHHKFAIFDRRALITGSYNWTRSAAEFNQENILVTDDERLVGPYRGMFERFWDSIE